MESTTNLHSSHHHYHHHHHHHHHQLQDHLVDGSSIIVPPSSLAFPSLSVQDDDHDHIWSRPVAPTFFLNNNNDSNNTNSFNNNSNSMMQDLSFSLPKINDNISIIIQPISHHHENDQNLINSNKLIKDESSTTSSSDQSDHTSSSFQTFTDMLNPSSLFQQTMQFQDNININNNNNNNCSSNGILSLGGESTGLTTFSQIFPSVNISKLSSASSMDDDYSSNFRGGLDLFAPTRFLQGGSNHPLELFKGNSHFGIDDLKLCNNSSNNNNLPSFNNNGVVLEQQPKRPSYNVEPKSTHLHHQTPSKKQRSESRASCPPFKVRKEKLGDRIAALQQLVAPFGKTDTASVLMEATGYIKFLQNQVETLSVPYMKLGSHNEGSNNIKRTSNEQNEDTDEHKQEGLRSRGLCLVPLTCMSYVTSDCGIDGPVWPPHHSFNFNPNF